MKRITGLFIIAITIMTHTAQAQDETAKRYAAIEAFKTNLINTPLTDFTLTGLDKKVLQLKALKGNVIVINFWFTTCGPCIHEIPFLNTLVENNKNKAVIFIAPAPDNEKQVTRFLLKNNFSYRVVPSALTFINAINVENFPTHLVVDKDGIIRRVFVGFTEDIQKQLQEAIDVLL